MKYANKYVAPILTVDLVAFRVVDGQLEVLLHCRPNRPFKGAWALPGGYCAEGQTTHQALEEIVLRKTGVDITTELNHVEQLYTFDTVARDPRGHAVSVVYMGCGHAVGFELDDKNIQFWPVDDLPKLAYDHADIVELARARLASKLHYSNIAVSLLDETFTLSEMQQVYEAVIVRELDKRNFRKKILSLDFIRETGEMQRIGAHRPAKLYAARDNELRYFRDNF